MARFWVLLFLGLSTASGGIACGGETSPVVYLSSKVGAGDYLTLPVEVEGERLLFIVDTGACWTSLDESVRGKLAAKGKKLALVEEPLAKSAKSGELHGYRPPEMFVMGTESGRLRFPQGLPVVWVNLNDWLDENAPQFHGVIGMDFLRAYCLDLDLTSRTLRLLDSTTIETQGHDATIEMKIERLRPLIPIVSSHERFIALIDTGAPGAVYLHAAGFQTLVEKGRAHEIVPDEEEETEKVELEIDKRRRGAWIDDFSLGPFTHHRLLAVSKEKGSLVGLDYWRRYRCLFDFPTQRVYLDKNSYFDANDDSDFGGVLLTRPIYGTDPIVMAVLDDSRGQAAGVRADDRLVAVDGKHVRFDRSYLVKSRLRYHPDHACELTVVRDGETLQITLPASGRRSVGIAPPAVLLVRSLKGGLAYEGDVYDSGIVAVYLSGTKVTDADLRTVSELSGLKALYLSNTIITDAGLAELDRLTHLIDLELKATDVSDAGVEKLQKALPECRIVR